MSEPYDWSARLDKSYIAKVRGASDAARKHRKALARDSEKQKIRTAFLAGIKAERMKEKPWCYNCGTQEEPLDLHHTIKRSQGPRYGDGDEYGVDNPHLLTLLCRRCHVSVSSSPEWGQPDDDRR